jgi:hypothetical protein
MMDSGEKEEEEEERLGLFKAVETIKSILSNWSAFCPRSDNRVEYTLFEVELCHLAQTHPDAFSYPCWGPSYYALHSICRYNASLETVKAVYQAFPAAISTNNDNQ